MGDQRCLRLLSRAGGIELEKLAGELQPLDAVYLGPVAWEVDIESISKLLGRVRRLALDPQGLMRIIDEAGFIKLKRLDLEIPGLWILRLSGEEAEVLTGSTDPIEMIDRLKRVGAEITILTLGGLGGIIAHGADVIRVPCYETRVFDSTGAGDVFGGAFIASYFGCWDLRWAAAIASAMASIAVEGPSFKPLISPGVRDEAERRAEKIYRRIEPL
jgi:sugar/nucleoside kinase (ribokinase family)